MAGALQPRRFGVWPLTTALRPTPRLEEPPGGEEKTQERRPKAYLVGRRRGRGVSRRDSRSEAEGTPKGLARPRSDSAPKGARGRLRRFRPGLLHELPSR